MVLLLGVLQGIVASPKLAAEVAIIHPATLASTPSARLQAEVILGQDAQLAAPVPSPVAVMLARPVIVANMARTLHPVIPSFAGEYDINVFRGPSHQVADDWQRTSVLTDVVADGWEVGADLPATVAADWQEGPALGTVHGQDMESLPSGHARVSGLWAEGEGCGQWHLSGYTHPPRGDKGWDVRRQEGTKLLLQLCSAWDLGALLQLGWLDGWDEAIWPLPGTSPPPKPPITPEKPEKRKLRLAFGRPRGDASLEFV